MGCSSSKYTVNKKIEGQGLDCQRALNLLKLDENEINKLYRCFVKFDLSGDGQLSLIEFLTILDLGKRISFLSFFFLFLLDFYLFIYFIIDNFRSIIFNKRNI